MLRLLLASAAIVGGTLIGVAASSADQRYSNSFSCIPSSCPAGRSAVAANKRVKAPSAVRQRTKRPVSGPGGLAGKQKSLGAGMVLPAVQGIVRAPPKKKGRSPSTKDCMSCD